MLIYVKNNKLYGTLASCPAEDDLMLTYKDENGLDLILKADDVYLDNKKGGIIRKSDNKEVNVFIGDVQVIGKIEVVEVADEQTLIESLNEGGVTKLTTDIIIDNALNIKTDTTINLNGKTIDTDKHLKNVNNDAIIKAQRGTTHIKDGVIDGYSKVQNWDPNTDYNVGVYVVGNAKVILENCVVKGGYEAVYVESGTVEILSGEFFSQRDASRQNKLYTLNCLDRYYNNGKAKIIVKGGKFYNNFNPADCESEGPHTNFVAEGYKVVYHPADTEEESYYEVIAE